jgi:hypothetical protein
MFIEMKPTAQACHQKQPTHGIGALKWKNT